MRASSPGVQGPSPPHAPQPIARSSSATTLALGSAREAHTHSFTSLHLLTELLGREPGALSVPSALWWGSSVTHPCLSPTGASSTGCLLLFPLDLPAQLLWVTGHQPSSTSLVPLTECLPTASQAGQGPAWKKRKNLSWKENKQLRSGTFSTSRTWLCHWSPQLKCPQNPQDRNHLDPVPRWNEGSFSNRRKSLSLLSFH